MLQQKGTTMPVDFIILIVIAIVVIVIAAVLIRTESSKDVDNMQIRKVFLNGCTDLRTLYNCNADIKNDIKYNDISLFDACKKIFGSITESDCKKRCGCKTT